MRRLRSLRRPPPQSTRALRLLFSDRGLPLLSVVIGRVPVRLLGFRRVVISRVLPLPLRLSPRRFLTSLVLVPVGLSPWSLLSLDLNTAKPSPVLLLLVLAPRKGMNMALRRP